MRRKGSPELLAAARRVAVALLLGGVEPGEVAEALCVSVRSVRRWAGRHRVGGDGALAAAPVPGRPPKLSAEQAGRVLGWVRDGDATVFGFDTPRWTAPRLAAAVQRELGVRFNHRYLNDWLWRRGVTPQLPQRVPRERDDAAVARWVARGWPAVERGRRGRARRWCSPTRPGC